MGDGRYAIRVCAARLAHGTWLVRCMGPGICYPAIEPDTLQIYNKSPTGVKEAPKQEESEAAGRR
eukprot:scaffold169688_cov29-Tisochrysis_lutea.AAC.1